MGRGHLWRIDCVAEEECSSEECRLEQAFVIMSFTAKLEKVRFVTLAKWGLDRDVGFCYSLTRPRFPDEDGGLITRAATLAPRAFSTPHGPQSLWRCIWHSQMSQHLAGRWSAQPGVTWGFHQPLEKTHKVELKVPKLKRSAPPPLLTESWKVFLRLWNITERPKKRLLWDTDQGEDKVLLFSERRVRSDRQVQRSF